MPKVHSHYENLKVARDASPEGIRAAYRGLTRRHHPDRNPGDADAQRIMSVINVAYGVLSDPAKRLEHDRWIAQVEASPERPVRARPAPDASRAHQHPDAADPAAVRRLRQARLDRRVRRVAAHVLRHRAGYGLAGAALVAMAMLGLVSLLNPGVGLTVARAPAAVVAQPAAYARPVTAPNGQRWPVRSGYVDGYPQLNRGGLSEVTLDNGRNDADVFAKLVALDGPTPLPVRTVFVAARGRLTLDGLAAGSYDLRYRNLSSGGLSRSPAFILEEVPTARGTQHSAPTVRLYESGEGRMDSYALGEADF